MGASYPRPRVGPGKHHLESLLGKVLVLEDGKLAWTDREDGMYTDSFVDLRHGGCLNMVLPEHPARPGQMPILCCQIRKNDEIGVIGILFDERLAEYLLHACLQRGPKSIDRDARNIVNALKFIEHEGTMSVMSGRKMLPPREQALDGTLLFEPFATEKAHGVVAAGIYLDHYDHQTGNFGRFVRYQSVGDQGADHSIVSRNEKLKAVGFLAVDRQSRWEGQVNLVLCRRKDGGVVGIPEVDLVPYCKELTLDPAPPSCAVPTMVPLHRMAEHEDKATLVYEG